MPLSGAQNTLVTPKTGIARLITRHRFGGDLATAPEVQHFITSRAVEINKLDDTGLAPMHWAVIVDNLEALEVLLDLGADANVLDSGGQTPLYHAAQKLGHRGTAPVSRLLARGADVNLVQHMGKSPLMAACQAGSEDVVATLLGAKADPKHADEQGTTAVDLADGPIRQLLLDRIRRLDVKKDKEGATCAACGAAHCEERPLKICSRCRAVMYCSPEHQRDDWAKHKLRCQPGRPMVLHTSAAGLPPYTATISNVLQASQPTVAAHLQGPGLLQRHPPQFKAGKQFVVKAQLPLNSLGDVHRSVYVYSEDRSISGHVRHDTQPELYEELASIIRSKGTMGVKGYFFASYAVQPPSRASGANSSWKAPCELLIYCKRIAPSQPW